ncbi:hypothetical protein BJF78_35940 [Pseudonocardia sp. CNS-139]|nr:hypothetical protein BJF78_35940 [Pseudonocardia sp. CNS-139]
MSGYEQYDRAAFVDRIAGLGHDRATAERMVAEYEAASTAAHGEPDGGWIFDDYDLAEVQRRAEIAEAAAAAAVAAAPDLARAVARVVADYRAENDDPDASLEDVIAQTRSDLTDADIDTLTADDEYGGPAMDAELAAAYRTVLAAEEEAFTPEVTSDALGVLDGMHPAGDSMPDSMPESASDGEPEASGTTPGVDDGPRPDDLGGDVGRDLGGDLGGEDEPAGQGGGEVDDCEISVACAAAAAAAAEAAAAVGGGDEHEAGDLAEAAGSATDVALDTVTDAGDVPADGDR